MNFFYFSSSKHTKYYYALIYFYFLKKKKTCRLFTFIQPLQKKAEIWIYVFFLLYIGTTPDLHDPCKHITHSVIVACSSDTIINWQSVLATSFDINDVLINVAHTTSTDKTKRYDFKLTHDLCFYICELSGL